MPDDPATNVPEFAVSGLGRARPIIYVCALGALACLLMLTLNPTHSKLLNLALLGCTAAVWIGLATLVWRFLYLRALLLLLPLAVAALFAMPGGTVDTEQLRATYIAQLKSYEGAPYHWGGESAWGIDCSGLPRKAFRGALLAHGLRHMNGRALREYAEHWWFDASAQALGAGYKDFTRPVGVSGTVREMSYADLLPGDLAVTANGAHMLVYLGDDVWTQADPGARTVVVHNGRTGKNAWFSVPISVHRWSSLVPDEKTND